MTIFLCGSFTGPFTGQMQTLLGVKESLNFKKITKVNLPNKGKLILYEVFLFLIKLAQITLTKRSSIIYLMINRSRISFWIRDLPILYLARIKGLKRICHLVGSDIKIFLKSLNNFEIYLIKKLYPSITIWIVLGDSMKKQIVDIYDELELRSEGDYKLKPNIKILRGFYPKEVEDKKLEISINQKKINFNKKINIGYMSNFIEEKGIVEFIESTINLREKYNYPITCWIAGSFINSPSDRVKKAIRLAKTKKYFEVSSLISGDSKWQKLIDTDIFILPTYYKVEALPLSLVEAMKFKCFCISSKIGEIPDLLENNRGVMLEEVNTNNLVQILLNVITDSKKSYLVADRAHNYASEIFSFKNFKAKLNEILNL